MAHLNVYIKISDGSASVIQTLELAQEFLKTIIEGDPDEVWQFSVALMTEEEFNNLPEFEGF